jgi:A/G-specific adenine glycosylase
MPVLINPESGVYLQKRPATGIWGGLWSLPENTDRDSVIQWFNQHLVDQETLQWLPERKHTFSHFHLHFQPVLAQANQSLTIREANQSSWYKIGNTRPAMPAPIQKLLNDIML